MKTYFIKSDAFGVLQSVRVDYFDGFQMFENCPEDVMIFPDNFRIKNGQLVSIANVDFPYPERTIRMDIKLTDIAKMVLNPAFCQLIKKMPDDCPYIERADGTVTIWFTDLNINETDTAQVKAIFESFSESTLISVNPASL